MNLHLEYMSLTIQLHFAEVEAEAVSPVELAGYFCRQDVDCVDVGNVQADSDPVEAVEGYRLADAPSLAATIHWGYYS